jgi:hypothetical protein
LHAQDSVVTAHSAREQLRWTAVSFAYPNGMLFHDAFREGVTTRLLLLKTALESDELGRYLSLDETQRDQILQLRAAGTDARLARGETDLNAQPDEQVFDNDFFDFLRAEQLVRLDAIAFRYDGYAALSRISLASHLQLSDESQKMIASTVKAVRKDAVLPYSRQRFAGPQPADAAYRDCQFAGSLCTQVNLRILEALTDEECARILEFVENTLGDDHEDWKVVLATDELASLPNGVWTLADRLDRADLFDE